MLIFIYVLTVTGSTYAYFALTASNNSISGTAATANLSLTVTRQIPSTSTNLVPQLETTLSQAVTTYKCVDDNNNNVCQVYKIIVKNTSTSTVDISGYINFTGITNMPNLKWRLIDSETTYGTHTSSLATSTDNLFVDRVQMTSNESKTYYMVIWINETGSAQTDKGTFGATVTFKSSNGTGVTSTIGEIRKGENLVKNGDLSLGNNTNFSSFTYGTDSAGGYLSYTGSSSSSPNSNEYIYIDTSKKYSISFDAKANNTTSIHYAGFKEYDVDLNQINAYNVIYISGSTTSLAKDLKNGDTVVYLNDVSGFQVSSSIPTYQRGLIFWNYTDSTGYTWPEETYSRNIWNNLYTYDKVDTTNNTITLSSAWTHGTISSGTKLSQSYDGYSFNYSLLINKTLTTSWQSFSNIINGVNTSSSYNATKFRYGTVYIRPTVLFNYNNTANTIFYMKNFVIKQID